MMSIAFVLLVSRRRSGGKENARGTADGVDGVQGGRGGARCVWVAGGLVMGRR